KNTMGIYGKKTSTYRDLVINQPKAKEFFNDADNIEVLADALDKTEDFWENARHEKLTAQELRIYNMVDTLKTIPAFNTYLDIITLLVSGYYVTGNVEIGPYFTFYYYNPI